MVGSQSKAGRIVRSLVNTGGLFSFEPRAQLGQAQYNAGRHDEEIGFAWNMRNGRTSTPFFRLTSRLPPSRKKTHHWVGGPDAPRVGVVFFGTIEHHRQLRRTQLRLASTEDAILSHSSGSRSPIGLTALAACARHSSAFLRNLAA